MGQRGGLMMVTVSRDTFHMLGARSESSHALG